MTAFLIKLIACLAMLTDHANNVFGSFGWAILPDKISIILAYIGRIAFPIFAFMIVNGFIHTRNKRKYFSNMLLFGTIAQIPYTLALFLVNHMPLGTSERMTIFMWPWAITLALSAIIIVIYIFVIWKKKKDASLIWLITAFVFLGLHLKVNGIWITSGDALNVFYTLALGIAAIYLIQSIMERNKDFNWVNWSLLIVAFIAALLNIGVNSDYGIVGIALIIALYLCRKNKALQAVVIIAWSFALYCIIIFNLRNAIASCFAIPFILFYNNKKGYRMKYAFYAFYPVHLLALGIFNIVQRLST